MSPQSGDVAWVLASAALVMLMTPGLAFFYAGMVRGRSVLNTLMMTVVCLAVVTLTWVVAGFHLTFGDDGFDGLIGHLQVLDLRAAVDDLVGFAAGDAAWPGAHPLPLLAFAMFQLMFAVITPALLVGTIVERMRFWAWVVFVALWSLLVYAPIGHWVFAFDGFTGPDSTGGWIANDLHAVDFAGGTVVHMNAGAAALALALVLGRRRGWPESVARPHNVPFVLLGASLLWFGWYGFNAGSALAADGLAALAFVNTTIAACAAVLAWLLVEQVRTGRPTTLGAASGAVAGLVAITPACGYVDQWGALVIGVVAGVLCPLACAAKWRLRLDDSLDVVAIHLVGGLVGTLLIGVFASRAINPVALDVDGLLYGGDLTQLVRQAIAAGAVFAYSFVVTFVLGWLLRVTVGIRVSAEAEQGGVDFHEHAESAYDLPGTSKRVDDGNRPPRRTDELTVAQAQAIERYVARLVSPATNPFGRAPVPPHAPRPDGRPSWFDG